MVSQEIRFARHFGFSLAATNDTVAQQGRVSLREYLNPSTWLSNALPLSFLPHRPASEIRCNARAALGPSFPSHQTYRIGALRAELSLEHIISLARYLSPSTRPCETSGSL
jgi:hypothetical protein